LKEIIVPKSTTPPSSPKRPPKKIAAPSAVARAKRPAKASAPPGKPFLRFYHSEALRAKTLAVLTTIEKAKDGTQHRDALAGIVVELTDSGLDYYFMRSLKVAKAGFFVEQTANLGLGAAKQVFASVIRNIIGRLDTPQLLSVCGTVRQLMK
jgi:hypothetical protein